jgi:hypothetical protein
VLTQAQGDAVLADLNRGFAAAQQRAAQNQEEGESGIVAGVLELFGLDHISQLDAQVGAVGMMGTAIARLQSILPAAVADSAAGDRWSDAAKSIAQELESVQDDITSATIEDTLAKTATASGTQVKQGINMVAGNVARLTWSAIPWWVLAGGALVAGGYVYLQVRRVA